MRSPESTSLRFGLIFVAAGTCACGSTSPSGPEAAHPAPQAIPATSGSEVPANLVTLRPLADVTAVAPGQELTVAAELTVVPGWHIYWTNPGDSGLRTDVTFSVPAGFRVGDARFPGPTRYGNSEVVTYGYDQRVLVSARVIAPDPLPADSVEVNVSASWLACRESCVPGQARATLQLPAASARAPSGPANASSFAAHEARLPRPLGSMFNARPAWTDVASGAELVIYVDGSPHVEFFPERDLQTVMAGQAVVGGEGVSALHLSFRRAPKRVRGVMLASDGHTNYYFDVDVAGPATDLAGPAEE